MADTKTKIIQIILQVVNKAGAAIRQTTQQMTKLASAEKQAATAQDKMAASAGKAGQKVKGMGDEVEKTGKKAKSAGSQFMTLVTSFGQLAGVATSALIPLMSFAKFERAMAEVGAIAQATGDELVMLSQRAQELGATTEFTASDVAGGMKFLAMAGLDVTEVYEAIPGVLDLAKVGVMGVAEAADIATNILTGFGMRTDQLTRVNDRLVATFTNSNSSLRELGDAMSYVAPVAAGVGANFEEVTATLGMFHNAGIKGSRAGMSLRQALATLIDPTKKEADMMKELGERIGGAGFQAFDAQGNFVGMVDLIQQLEKAGTTGAEAFTLFGARAGPAMAALLAQGSSELMKMNRTLLESDGLMSKISENMSANLVGSWKMLTSAVEGLNQRIGKGLAGAAGWLVDSITNIVTAINMWADRNPALMATIVRVIGAIGALIAAVALAKIAMIAASVTAVALGAAWTTLTSIIGGLVTAIHVLRFAFMLFQALAGPIGWAMLAIGVAITGVVAALGIAKLANDRYLKSLDDIIKKKSEEADAFGKAQKLITSFRDDLAKMDKGSEKYRETVVDLKKKLEEMGKGTSVVSEAAKMAATSINETTGEITDSGAAIEKFIQIAAEEKYKAMGEAAAALDEKLMHLVESTKNRADIMRQEHEGITDAEFAYQKLSERIAKLNEMDLSELSKEDQKLIKDWKEMETQSKAFIDQMLEMKNIEIYGDTGAQVAELAEKMGIVSDAGNLMGQSITKAFEKMQADAVKAADNSVRSLLYMADKNKDAAKDMAEPWQAGWNRILAETTTATGDTINNYKYLGEQAVKTYQEMYKGMSEAQQRNFLTLFAAHEKHAQAIYNSKLDDAEKEKAMEESQRQFLVGMYQDTQNRIRDIKLEGYNEWVKSADEAARIEISNMERNTTDVILAEKAKLEAITGFGIEAERERAVIQARITQAELAEEQKRTEYQAQAWYTKIGAAKAALAILAQTEGTESETYKEKAKEIKAIEQDITKFKNEEYKKRTEALRSELDRALGEEKAYREKAKNAAKEQKDLELDLADQLRAIKRESMTEAQQQADIERQINEKIRESKSLLLQGEIAAATERANSAKSLIGELEDEDKKVKLLKGTYDVLTDAKEKESQSYLAFADQKKKEAEDLRTQLANAGAALDELVTKYETMSDAIATGTKVDVDTQEAVDKLQALQTQFETGLAQTEIHITGTEQLDEAAEKAEKLKDPIDPNLTVHPTNRTEIDAWLVELERDRKAKLTVTKVLKDSTGGRDDGDELHTGGLLTKKGIMLASGGKLSRRVLRLTSGKKLPGFGRKDKIPALLTEGERVLNPISTRILDRLFPGLMTAANRVRNPEGMRNLFQRFGFARFALGGTVGDIASLTSGGSNTSALKNLGVVRIPIGNQSFPFMATESVVAQFKRSLEREEALRGNL